MVLVWLVFCFLRYVLSYFQDFGNRISEKLSGNPVRSHFLQGCHDFKPQGGLNTLPKTHPVLSQHRCCVQMRAAHSRDVKHQLQQHLGSAEHLHIREYVRHRVQNERENLRLVPVDNWHACPQPWKHKIIESLRLEKTFKVMKRNC